RSFLLDIAAPCVILALSLHDALPIYMIHPEADPKVTVRSVFIIDPNKKIRLILTYPPSAGRNFAEILRCIDSLQLTDYQKVATPDRKSTRLNSSHVKSSYAVFCLKRK